MTPIATLTPNPALDISARTAQVVHTHKLRCSGVLRHAGGGGVNVARMLHRLGVAVQAHYLAGGVAGGQLAELLTQEGVPAYCQHIDGETRENLSVLDETSEQEFRFVMPGPQVQEPEWLGCLTAMAALRPAPKWLVASGSLPPGVPQNFYARLAHQARSAGVALALDTSGNALAQALDAGVALVKPSLSELRSVTGAPLTEQHEAIAAAQALVQRDAAQMVALSLGSGGAVLATREGVWIGPAVPVTAAQGATGAGDCFLAALLAALAQGKTPADALRWGLAAGSASLLATGTGLASSADVEQLIPLTKVSLVERA
ncbi:MAG: 1-phosphofructokinase family hexose kinase [Giesbergeria sp.]